MGPEIRPVTLEEDVRVLLSTGRVDSATNEMLRVLGPEVLGFLYRMLDSQADADEVFGATSERVWRSLGGFQWRCSLRTWMHVIARNEAYRFTRDARRRNKGRVTPSELEETMIAVRTSTRSTFGSERRDKLAKLHQELGADDRALLILRIDRDLPWADIAMAFLPDGEQASVERVHREAARLRKRFELVRKRLAARAKKEGLLPRHGS